MTTRLSRLLKSSLRPMTRAPSQVYQDHDPTIASPSCLGEGWLCAGGSRLPKKNPALFGPTETPAGPTCTQQGHPITYFCHTNKEFTSTAWRGLPMWLGPRHPFPTPSCCWAAVVLQRPLPRLCQVLRSGQVFISSLLQMEEPLHCVTMDIMPAGFPTKTRL